MKVATLIILALIAFSAVSNLDEQRRFPTGTTIVCVACILGMLYLVNL